MDISAKERARQSAIARSKPTNKGTPLSQRQGRTDGQGNQLTFFSEDSQGMKLSPQTVMLICLLYIGSVVVLHIFGKVKAASSGSSAGTPQPDMGGANDLWTHWKSVPRVLFIVWKSIEHLEFSKAFTLGTHGWSLLKVRNGFEQLLVIHAKSQNKRSLTRLLRSLGRLRVLMTATCKIRTLLSLCILIKFV